MPALIQICIVMATIALLAIAWMAVRTMARFHRTSEEIARATRAVRESAARFDLVSHEAAALLGSLRDCVPPVLRVVRRFEDVSQRAADLTSTLLDVVERPLFTVAAVVGGVRTGASHFLSRLMLRFTQHHTPDPIRRRMP